MSGIGGGAGIFTGPVPNRIISRLATQSLTAAAEKAWNWYNSPPMSNYNRYRSSSEYQSRVKKPRLYKAPRASRGFYGPKGRMKRCIQEVQERKFIDVLARTDIFDVTGVVVPINLCATGTDYTERIGRKTTALSLQIRGVIEPNAAIVVGTLGRILCVYDSQVNGALPAVNDILVATSALSFMNLNNRDRFKILFDWNRPFGHADTFTAGSKFEGGHEVGYIKKFKKCNLPTVWDGTAATIGSCQTGAIYIVIVGTTAQPTYHVTWQSRVRFIDN